MTNVTAKQTTCIVIVLNNSFQESLKSSARIGKLNYIFFAALDHQSQLINIFLIRYFLR